MDPLLMQRTRYVLHSRFRRIQACPPELFASACHQTLSWCRGHPLISSHIARLESIETNATEEVPDILRMVQNEPNRGEDVRYEADSIEAHAAICLSFLKGIAETASFDEGTQAVTLSTMAKYFIKDRLLTHDDEVLQFIKDVVIDGLFEYLDEQLDQRGVMVSVLLKYKQRCEWFCRSRLRAIATDGLEGRIGERALALDLYGYVLDQGNDFAIEPTTASGEPDLVIRTADERHIVFDAKLLRAGATQSEVRRALASGFHQVARYCEDYSEPDGFLVVFLETPVSLELELQEGDVSKFLAVGSKSVHFQLIDISERPSASRSGPARVLSISRSELLAHPDEGA